jgi:hypothetical protein
VHPERQEIEKTLLGTEKLPDIAQRFALSRWSLYRHKQRHLLQKLKKAQDIKEKAQANSLLRQMLYLQSRALTILKTAEASGELETALRAIREARGNLELLAKLQGDLAQEGTINIVLSPSWISLRTIILRTLEPYPEAKLKIAQALGGVDHAGS